MTDSKNPPECADVLKPVVVGKCIISRNAPGKNGYVQTHAKGVGFYVHRMVYQIFNGPLRRGMWIDHICNNRCCINPAHLELVTPRINLLRSGGASAVNYVKTHCPRGHPLSGENLYYRKNRNQRECRACASNRSKKYVRSRK